MGKILQCPGNLNFYWTGDTWSKSISLILANYRLFFPQKFLTLFKDNNLKWLSLQTSLLCKVGELARRGSLAVAVTVGAS